FRGVSRSLVSLEAKGCYLDSSGVAAIFNEGGFQYLNLPLVEHGAIGFGGNGANLKILDIGCNHVDYDAIKNIPKGCPLLEEWNVSCCMDIDIFGWKSIGLYCQSLKTIHANRQCFDFDDEITASLTALSRCRRLSVIYMCIGWWGYQSISPEILNEMREDVKIIVENNFLSTNTISWDNRDYTT
nr:hypothetical protein [Tanacetum cinerariifolium]